jgi:ABC-type xylose transport system permease subunit
MAANILGLVLLAIGIVLMIFLGTVGIIVGLICGLVGVVIWWNSWRQRRHATT